MDQKTKQKKSPLRATRNITKTSKKDLLFIIGDFNANIGKTSEDNRIRNNLGVYGIQNVKDKGESLLGFAINNNLTIANKNHLRRLSTWTSPYGLHKN